MKFADIAQRWLLFALWVVYAGLGNWWVGTACGGSAFGVVFAVVYMTGVIIQANR